MDSFLEGARELVQCSICNETLSEPKLLQCFHTFCKPCIQKQALFKDQVHIFKCPRCSSETMPQELNDIEDLKTSTLHSRLLQVLSLTESDKSQCSISASHSPALWQCVDCDRSLCDECLKFHSTFTKEHQVVSLADLKKEDLECLIPREDRCKIHPNNHCELWCDDCSVIICSLCSKDGHNEHNTKTLCEIVDIKKDSLSKNLDELEMLKSKEMEKKQQKEIAINMIEKGAKAKKEVQKMTKKVVKSLLDQEQQFLDEIQESIARAERNLQMIDHIPAAQEYIKNIITNEIKNAGDMVDYSKQFSYKPFKCDTFGIVFSPSDKLSLLVMTHKLGEIHYSLKSSSILSKIESDSNLKAFMKGKLTVLTKTSTGAANYDDTDEMNIQIIPENGVKMERPVKIGDKIEVQLVPQVPGELVVHVKLNGIHVSNSPLPMQIKPQIMKEVMDWKLKTALNDGQSKEYTGIAVNKANSCIAIADISLHCVKVFNMAGKLLVMYGGKGSEPGQLLNPQGLAFLNNTNLVIAEDGNHRISILDTATGTLVKTFSSYGNGNGELANPQGVHVDEDDNIIVCDTGNHRVQVFTKEGNYEYQFAPPNEDNFKPHSVIKHNGLFYVSDWNNRVVYVIIVKENSPTVVSTIGGVGDGKLENPSGLAIDNDSNLLVCDRDNIVTKFTLEGHVVGHAQDSKPKCQAIGIIVMDNGQTACTLSKRDDLWFLTSSVKMFYSGLPSENILLPSFEMKPKKAITQKKYWGRIKRQ